jgi:hypothetical protein
LRQRGNLSNRNSPWIGLSTLAFYMKLNGVKMRMGKSLSRFVFPPAALSNKFVVVSFDTLPQQLQVLKEGYLTALIGQRPYQMGVQSIDALHRWGGIGTKRLSARNVSDVGAAVKRAHSKVSCMICHGNNAPAEGF